MEIKKSQFVFRKKVINIFKNYKIGQTETYYYYWWCVRGGFWCLNGTANPRMLWNIWAVQQNALAVCFSLQFEPF